MPNFYSSYYLYGLRKCTKIHFDPSDEFKEWNGWPFLILKKGRKLFIIDNADPVCVRQDLYDEANIYFATNKLLDKEEYNQPKMQPLYPHYPINCWKTYLEIFKKDFFMSFGKKKALKEIYFLQQRPKFRNQEAIEIHKPYVFFAGSIWKKEEEANLARAKFIRASKSLEMIEFEGGLLGRTDGTHHGYEDVLSPKKYSPREFSRKSAKSFVVFNNPAVLGAVSWRFAEYLNNGNVVVSLPWKIHLPDYPKHGKEIHMITEPQEIKEILRFLINHKDYHSEISKGGKEFFKRNCHPLEQAKRILANFSV